MKNHLLHILIFLLLCNGAFAQAGEWTWMHGDSVPNSPGVFGTQGVPDSINHPPAFYAPCGWTDLQGNFWLFGGTDFANGKWGDLWKYEPSNNQWTWVKGTGLAMDGGNFGIKGVPNINNRPPSRGLGAATWIDLNGDFWLYGGAAVIGIANDLWKYNVASNTWIWMKGPQYGNNPAVYGTLGLADSNNTPGKRFQCNATWVDNNNNLWLFGGYDGGSGNFNDLWKYDQLINQWIWMKGSKFKNQSGVYGTKGVPASANVPGARSAVCHWKDNNGNFWFFGGNSYNLGDFNDMWMYNPLTNNWTWMSGTNVLYDSGYYGIKCITSLNNLPPSRYDNHCFGTDLSGNFWLYGGGYFPSYGDLWTFNPTIMKWTFVSGDSLADQFPIFGSKGVAMPTNKPGSRIGTVGWIDSTGNFLYLFGGNIASVNWIFGNDLWRYEIDPNCPQVTAINEPSTPLPVLIVPNPFNDKINITFQNPNISKLSLTIKNVLGQIVYSRISSPSGVRGSSSVNNSFEIDLSFLPQGIYLLDVMMDETRCVKKIVKN